MIVAIRTNSANRPSFFEPPPVNVTSIRGITCLFDHSTFLKYKDEGINTLKKRDRGVFFPQETHSVFKKTEEDSALKKIRFR